MKVVFVVGPTASGKSNLALQLAQEFKGAIINCDSIQLYQGLEIGSAMPSPQERQLVPHFLFDQFAKGEELTVGDYYRHFFAQMDVLKNKFPVVFVVGGTGFYFQAIEKGLFEIGAVNEATIAELEKQIELRGPSDLYQELLEKDPVSAKKISINDHYRLVRAIEILRTHGKSKSEVQKEFQENQKPFPFPLLKIGIQARREELEPLVEIRTQQMLDSGLVDEVKSLVDQGLRNWAPIDSIGYRECLQFLEGKITEVSELKSEIVKNTLKLAKKQRTWFQRDLQIHWLKRNELAEAKILLRDFLKN